MSLINPADRVQRIQIVFHFISEFVPQENFSPNKKEIPQDHLESCGICFLMNFPHKPLVFILPFLRKAPAHPAAAAFRSGTPGRMTPPSESPAPLTPLP